MKAVRWPYWAALALLAVGLAGFTGSSYWFYGSLDPLLTPHERSSREVFAHNRAIRSDEWAVDTPLGRVQQTAVPAFPIVNRQMGLGHLQRNPFDAPVLDWGLAFRPLVWPLLLGNLWSHGVLWFLRSALLFLGLYALMRAVVDDPDALPDASRRRANIAGIAAIALFFSSWLTWWLSHGQAQVVAFAGLVVLAARKRRDARTLGRRLLWTGSAFYFAACAFFNFFAPIWAPILWVVSAAVFDLHWKTERNLGRAALRTIPVLVVVAAGAIIAILYYTPYLALVADTIYPGRRIAVAGELPSGRLVDMIWPALEMISPMHGHPRYRGKAPGMNECEAACIECAPFLLLGLMAVLDGPVRRAVTSALRRSPAMVVACAVLGAWLMLPLPRVLGDLTLLRWSPWNRTWLPFGLACAALAAAALTELAAEQGARRWPWRYVLVATGFLLVSWCLAAGQVVALDPRLINTSAVMAVLIIAGVAMIGTRWAAPVMALAWAVPLVLANGTVNPLLRSRDLYAQGEGHAVVNRALQEAPGRIVDYTGMIGATMAGFGWPMLSGLQTTPDLDLFRFLSPDAPGLSPAVYNRYAHVRFALPPEPSRLDWADAIQLGISPCSQRLAALGVNHFLTRHDAKWPSECADAFQRRRAGDLVLWSRKVPVRDVGVAVHDRPSSALDFDYIAGGASASAAEVHPARDGLEIEIAPGERRSLAIAMNLGTIGSIHCERATATTMDAHVVVEAVGRDGGRCRVNYIGTVDAVWRLLAPRSASADVARR